jgi:hypothetical protein
MYDGVKAMIEADKTMAPKPVESAKPVEAAKPVAAPKPAVALPPTMCGPEIKSVAYIKGFPTFPEGTKSLLSKYLTKPIWEEYKDMKDSAEVSFKTCIVSGCQNIDSGIGAYAGSHDSYYKFNKLFDAII